MQGGNQKPCKFGPNCKHFAMGTCNFYHAPGGGGKPNQPWTNNDPNQSGFGHRRDRNPNQNPNFNSNNQPNFNQSGGYNNNNRPPQNKAYNQSDDGIQNQLCRNFQLGLECKFK